MTKRLLEHGLRSALLALLMAAACAAADPRETPLVQAIRRAKACVVNIHSEKTSHDADSLFAGGKGRKVNGMGTGIVVDERGYIVTNHHVVDGVDSLRVTLVDGGTYDARVVSFDRAHDLAIIRIQASRPLEIMPLGTSSDLMLGETVIAVGNAYGYEHTVTAGIVSALGRDVEVNEKQAYKNLIQTDASINPGNSGGPLVNLKGEVVGINVAIRAGAQRIGFAIPIDDARKTIAELISAEQLGQAWHGLAARDVKTPTAQRLVVDRAEPDSPAARAGLVAGDVVLRAGNVPVVDGVDLERALLGVKPGQEVPLQVRRGDATRDLKLTLGRLPNRNGAPSPVETVVARANNDAPAAAESGASQRAWNVLGVRLRAIPPAQRSLVGPKYHGGMQVVEVRGDSSAAQNGIRTGDVLVGLHLWETTSDNDLSYVLDHPELGTFDPLKFYILRGSETLYGHLRVAAKP
ncbi:MAG: trypsin-like peptidase domain-containing protein [Planctomycetales bacterium]